MILQHRYRAIVLSDHHIPERGVHLVDLQSTALCELSEAPVDGIEWPEIRYRRSQILCLLALVDTRRGISNDTVSQTDTR